jgi:hypothetical protein
MENHPAGGGGEHWVPPVRVVRVEAQRYPLLAPIELPSIGCWLSALSGILDQFGYKVTEPLVRPIPYVSYFFRHDPARRD